MQRHCSVTSTHSNPVDIKKSSQRTNEGTEDLCYPGSSLEDEFYSPPSSPTRMSPIQKRAEATSKTGKTTILKEHFFTPTASTPEILRKMVKSAMSLVAHQAGAYLRLL